MALPALLLAIACHSAGSVPVPVPGLHGLRPEPPASVGEFSAVNQDGAPRSRADLLGHPTAVWFFPAAGTPG